jgi:hypothetical protein
MNRASAPESNAGGMSASIRTATTTTPIAAGTWRQPPQRPDAGIRGDGPTPTPGDRRTGCARGDSLAPDESMFVPRRRKAATVLGVVILFVAVPARAHQGIATHWDQRVVVLRDETGSADVRASLERATAAWNDATETLQLRVEPGTGTGCRGADGEVQVCLTRSDGYAGSTQTDRSGSHLRSAVVLIDVVRSGRHAPAVVCHELGHALGLDHRSEGDTCMRPAPVVAAPDETDLRRVRSAHEADCSDRSILTHNGACVVVMP